MEPVNTRQDWPLGSALKHHRQQRGLSVKAAARRTNKKVSDGRWYQLESGYQQVKGQLIPISTTPATVAAAASAVDWDVAEALKLAGFDLVDLPPEPRSQLSDVSDEALVAEIANRLAQRGGDGGEQRYQSHHVSERFRASAAGGGPPGDALKESRDLG